MTEIDKCCVVESGENILTVVHIERGVLLTYNDNEKVYKTGEGLQHTSNVDYDQIEADAYKKIKEARRSNISVKTIIDWLKEMYSLTEKMYSKATDSMRYAGSITNSLFLLRESIQDGYLTLEAVEESDKGLPFVSKMLGIAPFLDMICEHIVELKGQQLLFKEIAEKNDVSDSTVVKIIDDTLKDLDTVEKLYLKCETYVQG